MNAARIAALLLAAAWLGGCETVVFEKPPVAAQACDPALVGTWLSVGDKPGDTGEVELRIDAACKLLFVEHEKSGTREGDPTPLHVGRDGRIAYAWVDARWVEKRMENHPDRVKGERESAFAAGDIVLLQYKVSGRRLEFRNADPKAFAHRIIDEKLKGVVLAEDGEMAVRVTAPIDPKALRDAGLFPRGEMRFVRAPADG
jgi:hypothetical protein